MSDTDMAIADALATGEYARLAAHIIENTYINGTVVRLDGALRVGIK